MIQDPQFFRGSVPANPRFKRVFRKTNGPVFLAHYQPAAVGGHVLTSSRVSQLTDFGPSSRHLIQGTAADRPVIESSVLRFTSAAAEWLQVDDAVIGRLPEQVAAEFSVDLAFELMSLGIVHTFVGWSQPGGANPAMTIGTATNNRIRVMRRESSTTIKTTDITTATLTTGKVYNLSLSFYGGLMSIWLDGILIAKDTNYTAGTAALSLGRFAMGARILTAPSLPLDGRISELRIR